MPVVVYRYFEKFEQFELIVWFYASIFNIFVLLCYLPKLSLDISFRTTKVFILICIHRYAGIVNRTFATKILKISLGTQHLIVGYYAMAHSVMLYNIILRLYENNFQVSMRQKLFIQRLKTHVVNLNLCQLLTNKFNDQNAAYF